MEVGIGESGWSGAQPDGRCVSASVNLPLHNQVQKFSGTGSPGWSRKKGHKMVVVVVKVKQRHFHAVYLATTRPRFVIFPV